MFYVRVLVIRRGCWPIYDKKQEQQFRKACAQWLGQIAKVNSLLPHAFSPGLRTMRVAVCECLWCEHEPGLES